MAMIAIVAALALLNIYAFHRASRFRAALVKVAESDFRGGAWCIAVAKESLGWAGMSPQDAYYNAVLAESEKLAESRRAGRDDS